jgi:hypothetical protein
MRIRIVLHASTNKNLTSRSCLTMVNAWSASSTSPVDGGWSGGCGEGGAAGTLDIYVRSLYLNGEEGKESVSG